MDLSNLSYVSKIFTIIVIIIIYAIIFLIIKIMYKDMKHTGKRKRSKSKFGLEILEVYGESNIKQGGVIPINRILTIGRKEDNLIILSDPYVSGYHAKIYVKDDKCAMEDLNSTNGTLVNDTRINGEIKLNTGDEIRIGKSLFKVI